MQEPTRGPLFAPTTLCLESASSATPTAVGMAERILGPVLEKRFGAEPTSITSEDLRSAVVASGSSFPSHVKDEDIITAVENLSTDELSPIVASEDASDAGGPAAGSPRRLLLSVQKKATGGAAASSADAKRQRAGKLRGKVTVRISSGSILTSLTRVYHGASRCALLDSAGGLWDDCADCSDDRASYGTAPKGKFMIATDPSVERAEKDGEGIHLTVVIAEQRPATDESLRTKATISAFEATAVAALRAIARAADAEDWKNMIISEARNLLEMRKTESSATHKSLRKAQAKTAQANAKAARLGALVTSLNSRYGRGARAAVDRVEQRRRYDLDQDMATLKVGDEVELFWTTIQLILIGSELRDPSASGEWHTAKIIKVNAAGGGLLFDVQYDDAEESQEKKVRLHSNKGRKWRRRPPAAAAVAAARGVVDMELEQGL